MKNLKKSGRAREKPEESRPKFSRAAWAAEILRQRIIDGIYPPGERIREAELQSEFGFSNGPVREALQIIVAAGLAEREPWQGVRVIKLEDREIIELFQLRLALMEYAADLAARLAPPEIIAQAEPLKQELREAFQDARTGSGAHPSFSGRLSAWLLAAAGNATIAEVWTRTVARAQIYVNASLRRHGATRSGPLVIGLIDAIVARDGAAARHAARELTRETLIDLDINGTL